MNYKVIEIPTERLIAEGLPRDVAKGIAEQLNAESKGSESYTWEVE